MNTRIDTSDMSVKIEISITWKAIQMQLDDVHYEIQKWYDDVRHKEGFEKELEGVQEFLEVGELNAEQQIRVLELIQDAIDDDEDMDEYQWVRDGIYNWIKEEFNFHPFIF